MPEGADSGSTGRETNVRLLAVDALRELLRRLTLLLVFGLVGGVGGVRTLA